jgi:hypothetical protein
LFVCDGIQEGETVLAWKNGRRNEQPKIRYFLLDYKEKRKKCLMSEDVKQKIKLADN